MSSDGTDKQQGYPGRTTKVIRKKNAGSLSESPCNKNQTSGHFFSFLALARKIVWFIFWKNGTRDALEANILSLKWARMSSWIR